MQHHWTANRILQPTHQLVPKQDERELVEAQVAVEEAKRNPTGPWPGCRNGLP